MDIKKPSILEGLAAFSVYESCLCGAGGIRTLCFNKITKECY